MAVGGGHRRVVRPQLHHEDARRGARASRRAAGNGGGGRTQLAATGGDGGRYGCPGCGVCAGVVQLRRPHTGQSAALCGLERDQQRLPTRVRPQRCEPGGGERSHVGRWPRRWAARWRARRGVRRGVRAEWFQRWLSGRAAVVQQRPRWPGGLAHRARCSRCARRCGGGRATAVVARTKPGGSSGVVRCGCRHLQHHGRRRASVLHRKHRASAGHAHRCRHRCGTAHLAAASDPCCPGRHGVRHGCGGLGDRAACPLATRHRHRAHRRRVRHHHGSGCVRDAPHVAAVGTRGGSLGARGHARGVDGRFAAGRAERQPPVCQPRVVRGAVPRRFRWPRWPRWLWWPRRLWGTGRRRTRFISRTAPRHCRLAGCGSVGNDRGAHHHYHWRTGDGHGRLFRQRRRTRHCRFRCTGERGSCALRAAQR